MHWTKERPTAPGFYFLRWQQQSPPFDSPWGILAVEAKRLHNDTEVAFWLGPSWFVDFKRSDVVEFAGPIPLPEEA